jgi:hypothetical protein
MTASWSQLTALGQLAGLDEVGPQAERGAAAVGVQRVEVGAGRPQERQHWNVPSSDFTALMAIPRVLPEVRVFTAAFRLSQSAGTSTPACLHCAVFDHSARQLELSGTP